MTSSIGIFSSEGRSESINISECQRKNFRLKLSGNREVCLLAEEILAVVNLSVFCSRQIVKVERRYLEHFARALSITCRDFRSMHINEILILEKLMNRISNQRADTEYRTEHIRSRTQVTDFSQELHGVALRLKRIIRCRCSFNRYCLRLNFKRLLCVRGKAHNACHRKCRAHIGFRDFFVIVEKFFFIYYLNGFEERSVI